MPFAQIVSAVRSKEGHEWIKRKEHQTLNLDTTSQDNASVGGADESAEISRQEELTQRILHQTQDLRNQSALYQDSSLGIHTRQFTEDLSGLSAKEEPAAVIARTYSPNN